MRKDFSYFCLVLSFLSLSACGLGVSEHNDTRSYTPLMASASACDLEGVKKELKRDHEQINIKSSDMGGATALYDAVAQDCVEVTQYLLENGANVNAAKTDGLTPLHAAARNGNIELVNLLLANKAKVNAVAADGDTPVDSAMRRGHSNIAEFLKQRGGVARRA